MICLRNGPIHINVPLGHPWRRTHQSHEFQRSDITIFCRRCGGNSIGGKTRMLKDPCNPANASPEGKSEKNKHHYNRLMMLQQGKCFYYPQ